MDDIKPEDMHKWQQAIAIFRYSPEKLQNFLEMSAECFTIDQILDSAKPFDLYDPEFDQEKECVCGHTYHRHFDWGNEYSKGCKYCPCYTFKIPSDELYHFAGYDWDTQSPLKSCVQASSLAAIKSLDVLYPNYYFQESGFCNFCDADGDFLDDAEEL